MDVSTPEAVQAVEDLIKSDRRVTLDEIATNLDISHGTVYAIVREKLRFSKVSCRWVPKMLTDDHKMQRLMASRASLRRYRKEGDVFLSRIVTTDETWVFHYEPESKRRSMIVASLSFIAMTKAQSLSVNYAMRSNPIEDFFSLYLELTLSSKYCQTKCRHLQIFLKIYNRCDKCKFLLYMWSLGVCKTAYPYQLKRT